jgi:8-oxo-dGTP diphosphatase
VAKKKAASEAVAKKAKATKGKKPTKKTEKKAPAVPRPPAVAVDTAVLTVVPPDVAGRDDGRGELAVLLVRSAAEWALPGTALPDDELLAEAVARSLRDVGLPGDVEPRQLRVFDALARDGRGRVLSVAHLVWLPHERLARAVDDRAVRLAPVAGAGPLAADHADIVATAVARARRDYAEAADPGRLLPETFPLHDLWVVHDAVAGHFDSTEDAFRLRYTRFVEPTAELVRRPVGRPARLHRRAGG